MSVLRLGLSDDFFVERRHTLAKLKDAPAALVVELLPEILGSCLCSDDEEEQASVRELLRGHLENASSCSQIASALVGHGLAALGLVEVLAAARERTKDGARRDLLGLALHEAGAPLDKALPALIEIAERKQAGAAHAIHLIGFHRSAAEAAVPVLRKLRDRGAAELKEAARRALATIDGEPGLIRWNHWEPARGLPRPLISRRVLQATILAARENAAPAGALNVWESEMNAAEEAVVLASAPITAYPGPEAFWLDASVGDVNGHLHEAAQALGAIDRLVFVALRQATAEALVHTSLFGAAGTPVLELHGSFIGATRLSWLDNEREILLQTSEQYARVFWYTTA